MIQVGEVLLSEDLFTEHFVCDLNACKGACCIEGDAGAPLTAGEVGIIEDEIDAILPYLTEEGKRSIEKLGIFDVDTDGEFVTSLNNGKECVFTTYDKNGTAKCGIEDAHRAGALGFKKPISCHLYPIRVSKLRLHDALNYHKWNICAPACECGSKLKVKVFQFLKEPLIRKYGNEWYQQLLEADNLFTGKI